MKAIPSCFRKCTNVRLLDIDPTKVSLTAEITPATQAGALVSWRS